MSDLVGNPEDRFSRVEAHEIRHGNICISQRQNRTALLISAFVTVTKLVQSFLLISRYKFYDSASSVVFLSELAYSPTFRYLYVASESITLHYPPWYIFSV